MVFQELEHNAVFHIVSFLFQFVTTHGLRAKSQIVNNKNINFLLNQSIKKYKIKYSLHHLNLSVIV